MKCPTCGNDNDDIAALCVHCGAALRPADQKIVTVLCAALDASTDIRERAFDPFAARVRRYDGNVVSQSEDRLIALFGAPITHEDDPRRALYAALELLTDAADLRIGVHTGLVIIGQDGDPERDETISLAAQVMALAPPHTVLVTQKTYRYVEPFFEFSDLGRVLLGGQPIYQLIREKTGSIQARGVVGLENVFVGREAELALLRPLTSAVQAGLGRVALLIGEPGLGKSRLLNQWRAETGIRWIEAQCQSFAQGFPYQLVTALLRALIDEGDDEPDLAVYTERLFGAKQSEVYPYLAHLLGVELDPETAERIQSLDPQSLAAQYADAFRRLLAAQPVAVICEDIHWADPSSVELLTKILPMIPVMRVLFCFTSRPERDVPGWRIVTSAREILGAALTEIQLKPLSDADSQQLLSTLLTTNALSTQVMATVRGAAEGNPFFVEELVRTLIENGTIRRENDKWISAGSVGGVQVPDNLNGLLLARIDRQPEAAKRALRIAAVIGRQFSVRVLASVLAMDEPSGLMTRLSALESASLIQLAQVEPELEYRFRHALLQEASYASLPATERQQLHLSVGQALERLYPERVHELAATLAHHFMEAGDRALAQKYFLLAAEYAARMYANVEAIAYYSRVLETQDSADPLRFQVLRERGRLYERVGDFEAARGDSEAALACARQSGDRPAEWQALIDLGFLWASRDYTQTGIYFQDAYELAQRIEDPRLIASALNWVGNWHVNLEEPRIGIQFHKQALKLFEELGDRKGILETVDLLSMSEMLVGDFVMAARHAEQTAELAEELNVKHLLATALAAATLNSIYADVAVSPPPHPFDERVASMQKSLQLVRSIGWRAQESFVKSLCGFLYGRSGDYGRGLQYAEESRAIAREIGHEQWQIEAALSLVQIYYEMCALGRAREIAEPLVELANRIGSIYWKRMTTALLALTEIALGELDRAESLLDGMVNIDAPPELVRAADVVGVAHSA